MSTESRARGGEDHRITPLELFFDLAMVFAFTQVRDFSRTTRRGAGFSEACSCSRRSGGRGTATPWLSSATDVDEGGIRLAMLPSTENNVGRWGGGAGRLR
jgi:hypothetical protein